MSARDHLPPGNYIVTGGAVDLRSFLNRTQGVTFIASFETDGRIGGVTTIHDQDSNYQVQIPTGDAYTVAQKLFPEDPNRVAEIRNLTLSYLAEQAGLGGRA